MITVTCILLGQYFSKSLVMRVRQLEAICVMLSVVRARLQYSCCPVDDLIEELDSREDLLILKFIRPCAIACRESVDFPVAWRAALSDKRNIGDLKSNDIESLISFGETLGTTAIEGQLDGCDLYKSIIKESLVAARKTMEKYSSLLPVLGALVGMGASVVII